jgi:acyl-CoA thioesterase I
MPAAIHAVNSASLHPFLAKLRQGEPALIVAFGDSITCNSNCTNGAKQWPELLHTAIKDRFDNQAILLVNAGIGGETVLDGLRRLDRDVLRFRPDLTVVGFATNDSWRCTDVEFRDGIEQLCDRLAGGGSTILLRTAPPIMEREPPPPHLWRADHALRAKLEIIRNVAHTRQLALCDHYAAWLALEDQGRLLMENLMADEWHPNAVGHRLMFDQLLSLFPN